jgi:hypothetical protein
MHRLFSNACLHCLHHLSPHVSPFCTCSDLAYMDELLRLVKQRGVAAPAPIEQRWTAGSTAPMSPAHGPPGSLHSWVGVIMYLPEDAEQRQAVTARWAPARTPQCYA